MSESVSRIRDFAAAQPIAKWLSLSVVEGDLPIFHLSFDEKHIGNPAIRALHGGVIASFLNLAMQACAHAETGLRPRPSSLSIDYLSSSRPEDMTGRVKILRIGRRLAFLEAEGWQAGGTRLVATARATFALE